MKNPLFLMPFFVLTLYFSPLQAKIIETTDPAYLCRVAGFITRNYTNVLKVHEEVVIYPVQTNLFSAYGISSVSNYFYQHIHSEKKQDELKYENGRLTIKIKWRAETEVSIDEKTGQGRIWQDEERFIKLSNRPLIYDIRLDHCEKISQEDLDETLLEFSFVYHYPKLSREEVRESRRRYKGGLPQSLEIIKSLDPVHE